MTFAFLEASPVRLLMAQWGLLGALMWVNIQRITRTPHCAHVVWPDVAFCVGSDGSTDGTKALLQAWARDPNVRLTLNAERSGKAALRNRIVPFAKGEVKFSTGFSCAGEDAQPPAVSPALFRPVEPCTLRGSVHVLRRKRAAIWQPGEIR